MRVLQQRIDSASVQVARMTGLVAVADSQVRKARAEVDSARARVVIVDKTVQPQIDSAVVALGATLDSVQKIQLNKIETGYKSMLAVRDSQITALSRLTVKQDSLSAAKDSVIVALRNLQKTTYDAWQNAEKRVRASTWRRVTDVALTLGAVYVGGKITQ